MRTFARTTSFLTFVALVILFVSGCDNPKTGSIYDPNVTFKPQPTIASATLAGTAFAGIDTVVISGTNFSSVLAENFVFFNATPALTLVSSTPTQIKAVPPLLAADSVAIRVNVFGSDMFSNTYPYKKLIFGLVPFGGLITGELATSITTDAAGNIYSGYSASGKEAGLLQITPAGVRANYAPLTPAVSVWSSLKMGPGGYIYAARNLRAIYRFSPGGGSAATIWGQVIGTILVDFDFDQNGNVWAGGPNSNIYRIAPDKTSSSYPFVGIVHSLRVYNGYLYFSAKTDAGGEQIWRAQISDSGLGTPEVYFNFAAAYPTYQALAITFSSDGILYIGTDSPGGLVIVNPDKSYSAPWVAYKSVFTPSFFSLAWGAGNDLYATSSAGVLMKITVRGKKSAPYYGSTL